MNTPDIDDWKYEVANGDTVLGFEEWKLHKDGDAPQPTNNKVWIGQHDHRHGTSLYAFRNEISGEQFIEFLGSDYEGDSRDDENAETFELTIRDN